MTLHEILTYPETHPWLATLGALLAIILRVALSYSIGAPSDTRLGRARDTLDAVLPLDLRKLMGHAVTRIDDHLEIPDHDADTIPPTAPDSTLANHGMHTGAPRSPARLCDQCGAPRLQDRA